MESSGPLIPDDVSLCTSYPSPVIVPLDFIVEQTKAARDEMEIDESGMYILSKALEEFMRQILRESTSNTKGPPVLEYDALAKYIATSEFRALKEFFPKRVKYGDIKERVQETTATLESTSQPSSSSQ